VKAKTRTRRYSTRSTKVEFFRQTTWRWKHTSRLFNLKRLNASRSSKVKKRNANFCQTLTDKHITLKVDATDWIGSVKAKTRTREVFHQINKSWFFQAK
jgi:hypothetical protein